MSYVGKRWQEIRVKSWTWYVDILFVKNITENQC